MTTSQERAQKIADEFRVYMYEHGGGFPLTQIERDFLTGIIASELEAVRREAARGWISVEDRLPTSSYSKWTQSWGDNRVLVAGISKYRNKTMQREWVSEDPVVFEADFGAGDRFLTLDGEIIDKGEEYFDKYGMRLIITHWMPLPEPPNKEKP